MVKLEKKETVQKEENENRGGNLSLSFLRITIDAIQIEEERREGEAMEIMPASKKKKSTLKPIKNNFLDEN